MFFIYNDIKKEIKRAESKIKEEGKKLDVFVTLTALFFLHFELGTLHFYFALGPANYVTVLLFAQVKKYKSGISFNKD